MCLGERTKPFGSLTRMGREDSPRSGKDLFWKRPRDDDTQCTLYGILVNNKCQSFTFDPRCCRLLHCHRGCLPLHVPLKFFSSKMRPPLRWHSCTCWTCFHIHYCTSGIHIVGDYSTLPVTDGTLGPWMFRNLQKR